MTSNLNKNFGGQDKSFKKEENIEIPPEPKPILYKFSWMVGDPLNLGNFCPFCVLSENSPCDLLYQKVCESGGEEEQKELESCMESNNELFVDRVREMFESFASHEEEVGIWTSFLGMQRKNQVWSTPHRVVHKDGPERKRKSE